MNDTPLINTFVIPFWLQAKLGTGDVVKDKKIEIIGDRHVPDDKIYLVDKNGRVHCFNYGGMVVRDGMETA